jgi:hypothetical protein
VLAVVHQQEEPAIGQEPGQHLHRLAGGLVGDAERVRDRLRNEHLVLQRGQFDQPDAVGEGPPQRAGHPQRQPGLADATDAGQRHQARRRHQPADLGHLRAPPDEAAQLRRDVARR